MTNKIRESNITDGAVTSDKLDANAVTSAKLNYPLTTFSSTGIDDNASGNAITIESSKRVQFTRPRSNTLGDSALEILPSDTVAGIGFRMENTNNDLVIEKSSPSGSEAEILRIRIGGGIALGGTGDANTLDDYEEGTWTPAAYAGVSSFSVNQNTYTKIGRSVTIYAELSGFASKTGSALQISGLPFTPSSGSLYMQGTAESDGGAIGIARTSAGTGRITFFYGTTSRTGYLGTNLGGGLRFTITYFTD